ncbi:hypothetical protein [Pseudomonas fluorescens]|uniref:Uncharacterized protein n=1 Tax=Pseudomonas fluorescens TaxID=294 RepID=A0AAE2A504_PSEFL|nr:hypothetical protein [Pseudomonas fluorescens]KIF58083.1 hypothetical protein QS95_20770 [Pseudomonas fluorescens]
MHKISVDEIIPVDRVEVGKLVAEFKIALANSDFEPIKKIAFDGFHTIEGQRYFWGFGPTQDEKGWVFRLDFRHFDFKPGTDYNVGSGGFSALLVEGGELMISGGRISEGIMRIAEMEPHEGKITGKLINAKAEGGRPDGSDMDPAYAREINFEIKLEK